MILNFHCSLKSLHTAFNFNDYYLISPVNGAKEPLTIIRGPVGTSNTHKRPSGYNDSLTI